jgi:competence protein ComEA
MNSLKEWLEIHKGKLLAFFVLLIIVFFYFYTRSSEGEDIVIGEEFPSQMNEQIQAKDTDIVEEPTIIMVDVKGAIKDPGVYIAEDGERVINLIDKAGGFTNEADINQVNLSQHVQDEMVIFVPLKGEINGLSQNTIGEQYGKLININKATDSELQTLPGVGPAKALAIIEYREVNGGYKTIDDLKKISGIGEKTFEKLAPLISVK